MTNLRNSVKLIGRLGNDPEVRTFGSGKKKATFSMSTCASKAQSLMMVKQFSKLRLWASRLSMGNSTTNLLILKIVSLPSK